MFVKRLTCFKCGSELPPGRLAGVCPACGKPLRVDFDLDSVRRALPRELPPNREPGLWRYRELLPLPEGIEPRSLGEGGTPLLRADELAGQLGMNSGKLWVKDEALNPTGSFKARGMAVAVAMAHSLGVKKLAAPSAGNAGGALAAYAALYGLEAFVAMPKDVPAANRIECELLGAKVELIDGLITDCGKRVRELSEKEGWFDVSTLREPYRIEGKKTMGYEIAEHMGWELPDVIIYPTGGGTGLIGMAKAFDEMQALGWLGPKRPRMVSVQASGCAPLPKAFAAGLSEAGEFPNAQTVASGLRVPRALGDFIMLDIIRKTSGTAIAVDDSALMDGAYLLGETTGVVACPEGGACVAALEALRNSDWIRKDDTVVIFNTASGTKYIEAFSAHPKEIKGGAHS